MANTNKRLDDLERATGGDDETLVFVSWGDGIIEYKGEKMTQDEFYRRHPDTKKVTLTWGDDDVIETT